VSSRTVHALTALAMIALVACGGSTSDPTTTTGAAVTTTDLTSTTTDLTTIPTNTTAPAADTTNAPAPVEVEVEVTGVVIAVDGSLAGIDSFVLRLEDGTDLALTPTSGLLFDGTAPISHVQDHMVSGNPVVVTYLATDGAGPFECIEIGDAGQEHSH